MSENCAINLETGETVCTAPINCGYVNGQYDCAGAESATGSTSSAATGNLPAIEAPQLTFSSVDDLWPFQELATQIVEFVFNAFLWLPRKVYEALADGLIAVINALPPIPALEAWANAAPALGDLSYVAYFLQLQGGIALVIISLSARFLLRRVPFIG